MEFLNLNKMKTKMKKYQDGGPKKVTTTAGSKGTKVGDRKSVV